MMQYACCSAICQHRTVLYILMRVTGSLEKEAPRQCLFSFIYFYRKLGSGLFL